MIKPTGLYTNIELKTAPVYYPGIEEKTLELVSRYGLLDRIIFSSFNWLSVFRIRQLCPEAVTGLLFDGMKLVNIGACIHASGIECYHPSYKLLDDRAVAELKGNGVRINAWTVNESEDILRCKAWDIDGLITNEPEKARELCR